MKKLPMALLALFLLCLGTAGIWFTLQPRGPNVLVGRYALSPSGPECLDISSHDGGYYARFFGVTSGSGDEIPMIPMLTADQSRIGGNTVNVYLIGLRTVSGDCMIFKVDSGWSHWGVTFPDGYGAFGAPGHSGVEAIYKK